jgi:hypothetical protein
MILAIRYDAGKKKKNCLLGAVDMPFPYSAMEQTKAEEREGDARNRLEDFRNCILWREIPYRNLCLANADVSRSSKP